MPAAPPGLHDVDYRGQRFPAVPPMQVPVLRSVGWELEEQALRRRILLAPIRVMAEEGNAQAMETLQEEEKTIDALVSG